MDSFQKFFANNYEIVDIIKENFIATAYDKSAKNLCVIKQRNLNSLEIYKILKNLNNPHIPEIFRIIQRENFLFVIEEHIDGQTLDEIFTYNLKILDENFIENILLQICDCLKILHENKIIHRDLTLSNIMITKNNFVMLIDFGIARIFDKNKISDTEFLGTKGYAAPEQYGLFDLEQSDSRTDIFNLGVSMKKLLGENYHGRLKKILDKCTNLNPAARYQNIFELIRDIKRSKKIFYTKKIAQIIFIATFIFFITQIDFTDKKISPIEEKIITPEKIDKKILPEEKIIKKFEFPEIKIPEDLPIEKNSEIKLPEIEIPAKKISEIKKSDSVEMFFYLNGELTENYGVVSGNIFIKNFDSWKILDRGKNYSNYFLFPEDWAAQLKIENFTEKDLINPRITVEFFEEKIIFEEPTIKSGEIREIKIPIANKPALAILGEDNISGATFHITLESQSLSKKILLIRYLET